MFLLEILSFLCTKDFPLAPLEGDLADKILPISSTPNQPQYLDNFETVGDSSFPSNEALVNQ